MHRASTLVVVQGEMQEEACVSKHGASILIPIQIQNCPGQNVRDIPNASSLNYVLFRVMMYGKHVSKHGASSILIRTQIRNCLAQSVVEKVSLHRASTTCCSGQNAGGARLEAHSLNSTMDCSGQDAHDTSQIIKRLNRSLIVQGSMLALPRLNTRCLFRASYC